MSATLRIERVVTRGTFALDGSTWDVDNNIWLIGDDIDVVIIDAALMHNRSSTWSPAATLTRSSAPTGTTTM